MRLFQDEYYFFYCIICLSCFCSATVHNHFLLQINIVYLIINIYCMSIYVYELDLAACVYLIVSMKVRVLMSLCGGTDSCLSIVLLNTTVCQKGEKPL